MRYFLFFLFLITTIPILGPLSIQAHPYQNYSISGTEYYELLNYQDISFQTNPEAHPEIQNRMIDFEKKLIEHTNQILIYLATHPEFEALRLRSETPLRQLGMILVYTGMYLLNVNNAILEGALDPKEFENIGDRYSKAQIYLELAERLVPEDDRIHSWVLANQLRKEKYLTGVVSDGVLDQIIGLAKKNPIFHLINALTMASDYDFGPEREAEILELTELMNSPQSPCRFKLVRRGASKQCKTTNKTPFAFQGVTVYFADEFLKTAVRLSDPAYAKRALKTYQRLNFFLFKRKTRRWDMFQNLEQRIELTKTFIEKGEFPKDYFTSRKYLDVYRCASCHQGGVAPFHLQVSLVQ